MRLKTRERLWHDLSSSLELSSNMGTDWEIRVDVYCVTTIIRCVVLLFNDD
jgi:hypothetical protein